MSDDLGLDDVEPVLSVERLKYWTRVAGGDPQLGLVLHHRNSLIAGILYADLLLLEVSLRNSFNRELCNEFGDNWPKHSEFKSDEHMVQAKRRARKMSGGKGIRHDKVMVNLQFSYWAELLERRKFRPVVARAFKDGDIDKIRSGLKSLVKLRNDVAHHEPVIDRDGTRRSHNLRADIETLNTILSCLHPRLGEWLKINSSIQRLVRSGFVSCKELKNHFIKIYIP